MNAVEMNGRMFKAKADKIRVSPCTHLRASNIGHPCERYLYLLLKHWDEQKPHDVGLQNIFDLGNTLEDHTIKNIKEAGFEVFTPTQRAWQLNVKGGIITGREDIRIKDENGELIPVEIKGVSPFVFDKLNNVQDFLHSNKAHIRSYPGQLHLYMLHFGKELGFFALTNKLTGETKFIEVPFDYDLGEEYLSKAERIYAALEHEEMPNPCEDISFCEGCALAHICGECRRIPADVELDDELDELCARKEELQEANSEYKRIDAEIKKKVGERAKIITGRYLIERKCIEKKEYTIAAHTEYRTSIRRL